MSFLPRALSLPLLGALTLVGCQGQQGSQSSGPPPKVVTQDEGLPDPVARVGGQDIALADLEGEAAAAVIQAQQRLYDARRQALDKMIDDRLADAEAKARGISKEDLLKKEVEDKIAKADDSAIEDFYNQNKEKMRQPLDQMKDRIRRHLERQGKEDAERAFKKGLRDKAKVEVFLGAPRIQVSADDDPRLGSADAPVTIIEFSDFQCPYCTKAAATVHEIKERYGDKVSIVFRDFPLPMHADAPRAAEAAQCANDQGKFWEYHDKLFANQKKLGEDDLIGYAQSVGADADKFKSCLSSNKHAEEVKKDTADGKKAGMTGTPGFYINGRFINGARPIETFTEIIDEELAAKGQTVPAAPAAPKGEAGKAATTTQGG